MPHDLPALQSSGTLRETVKNKTPLYGEWAGWRMGGRWLVAPNEQRQLPARVLGYAWEENAGKSLTDAKRENNDRWRSIHSDQARSRHTGTRAI